ncbi:MAG: NHL repeat-containing protein [Fuerstiella sp.]
MPFTHLLQHFKPIQFSYNGLKFLTAVSCLLLLVNRCADGQEKRAEKNAAEPAFQYPLAVVAASDGTIFVADLKLPGIWQIKDGKKSVYFQASQKFKTPLNRIRCLAIDHEGKLLAGCTGSRDVFRFDEKGQPVSLMPGPLPGMPMAIAVATDGTIYVADTELHRIWKTPAAGSAAPEEFAVINSPRGLTFDAEGNLVVLSVSSANGQIQKVTSDGKIEPFVKGHPFNFPHNIVHATDGSFFVTDNYDHCVWKIKPDGSRQKFKAGAPFDRPVGLCLSGENLLVTDPHLKTIFQLTQTGEFSVFATDNPTAQKPNAK